jgi:hypothetical protein
MAVGGSPRLEPAVGESRFVRVGEQDDRERGVEASNAVQQVEGVRLGKSVGTDETVGVREGRTAFARRGADLNVVERPLESLGDPRSVVRIGIQVECGRSAFPALGHVS